MKTFLKASALLTLLILGSCAHHGKCCGKGDKGQCEMREGKKSWCEDKKQCEMKKDEPKSEEVKK